MEESGFDLNAVVVALAETSNTEIRVRLFAEIREQFESGQHKPGARDLRRFIALLYINDAYIRYETAQLLSDYASEIKPNDLLQFYFAGQDLQKLWSEAQNNPVARGLIFSGFMDKNLRLRTKLLKIIHERDCRDEKERLCYHYGRGDYYELYERFTTLPEEEQNFLQSILRQGLQPEWNTDYHIRACARLLEQIQAAGDIAGQIETILKPPVSVRPGGPLQRNPEMPAPVSEFEQLLLKLNRRGIYMDGQIVYPEIQIGTKTGRVTYRKPGLQTWSREQRQRDILPPPGKTILRYDYQAIEPTLLLNFLLNEHLISYDQAATDDIYLDIFPDDRDKAKHYLNAFINGGPATPPFKPKPVLWSLISAIDTFRNDLAERLEKGENIQTIGGQSVLLEENEKNRGGKLLNRIVQGGAADFFNTAVLKLENYFTRNKLDAEVYFLLYDEVWITANKEGIPHIRRVSLEILNEVYRCFNLLIPVKVREYSEEE